MFSHKFRLFRFFGFDVGIDPSWIVLAFLVIWSLSVGYFPSKYQDLSAGSYWLMGVIGAVGLFISIVAHEFCHSLVARHSGMPMKGITLFIFGGVAEMNEEPPSPRDEFLIAAVGPASSFVMAGIFYGLNRFGEAAGWMTPIVGVLGYLALINTVLAIFNLVPAFPLDGGRMLRAVLWGWKGNLKKATRIASRFGEGFGVFLIVLGILRVFGGLVVAGMWMVMIGFFIRSAARMSYQQLLTRRALEGENLERFMNRDPVTVPPDTTISQLIEDYIYHYQHKLFPVVDGETLLGCITVRQLKEVPREKWDRTTVGEIAEACGDENTIAPDTDAVDVLANMHKNGSGRMMVVKESRLVGIISLKDLLNFLSLKVEFEEA